LRDENYSSAAVLQKLNAHRVTTNLQDVLSQIAYRLGLQTVRFPQNYKTAIVPTFLK